MRNWWRDVVATLLVAVLVVGYLVRGELWLVEDPRGMAGVALVLGMAACAIGGSAVGAQSLVVRLAGALGVLTLGLAVATLITGSELLLAVFVGAIVLLWAVATVRHLVVGRDLATEPALPGEPALPVEKTKVSA